MTLFKTALIGVLMALPLLASAADGWELEKDSDGVKVYTREVENSQFKAFKGESVLEVELNRAMALMDDTAACPQWMHACKSPVLIRKLTPLKRYTYMVNDFPWPAKDRALLLTATITQKLPERVVTVSLEALAPESLEPSDRSKLPEEKGVVLIEQAKGLFRFTPLGDNRTHVEYQMHLDPNGTLPASLVNAMLVDTPFNTLKAMQDIVKAEKYTDFRPF
ncbi:hypothetical protein FHR99_000220 [Litorivivens lipolytica]|uniref:START domain-containing protein n=1 Tax=Litorivivens lipolytica TaxID=1524264 RepID=A0A7W4W237_9GAMM|nr:START domain-containing protein [Litorivivens lipolytica]MBB3045984.1 hypothetical protein [Litorivivens lipolytica]